MTDIMQPDAPRSHPFKRRTVWKPSTTDEEINFMLFSTNENDDEEECTESSRLARYKKQLTTDPLLSNKKAKPSTAAEFLSDAKMKRAEALQERHQIDLTRIENEIDVNKGRLEIEKAEHTEQLVA